MYTPNNHQGCGSADGLSHRIAAYFTKKYLRPFRVAWSIDGQGYAIADGPDLIGVYRDPDALAAAVDEIYDDPIMRF